MKGFEMRAVLTTAALVAAFSSFSLPASAQTAKETPEHSVTANVGVVSEYRYRGIGQTKNMAGFTWGLSYIDSDAKGGAGQCYRNAFNRDLGKGTVVLTATKSF